MNEFKKGDRIKVTIEGCVGPRSARYLDIENSKGLYIGGADLEDGGVTIEKVAPPLPHSPGSVVAVSYLTYLLANDGIWRSSDRGKPVSRTILSGYDYEIIRDTTVGKS